VSVGVGGEFDRRVPEPATDNQQVLAVHQEQRSMRVS
jgi:hypothetical protein